MTVEQARKIPSKKYEKLTDSELELHIKKLRKIASALMVLRLKQKELKNAS